MTKRVFSFLMAMLMVFTMVPAEAFAQEDPVPEASESTVYTVGDTQWVRGEDGEPEGETEEGTFWLPVCDEDNEFVTRQGLCDQQAHTHTYACPEDCDKTHAHTEECYRTEYVGCVIHTHDETCATETRYDCGLEAHENHDGCVASESCTVPEHDHEAMACPQQVNFTCTAEHEHSVEAGCAHETVYTCGSQNHTHGDGQCVLTTSYDCGLQIHTHADCATSLVYTDCVEHTEHTESCETKQVLSCGLEAHTCVAEGCAADCAIPEHTHGPECDMESVYYKWELVKDTSDTFDAEKGLPIRFYIAAPGEAAKPSGNYTSYKSSLWGTTDGSTGAYAKKNAEFYENGNIKIMSEDGIRNVSDENLITEHIYKYPDGYTASSFKDFGSISFNGKTYSQEDYEIKWVTICYRKNGWTDGQYKRQTCGSCWGYNDPHIHIDGVLTKRVKPAEMKLVKQMQTDDGTPFNADYPETFTFKLEKLQHNNDGAINAVDTSFGKEGSIELTANVPKGSSSANIVGDGTEITFGYYRLTEIDDENPRWENAGTDITYRGRKTSYDKGPIYIQIATNGTFLFSSTYNGTYTEADEIIIKNTRKPYSVTYKWTGIPNGLTPLPEGRNDLLPGEEVRINTSYPKGDHVLGEKGKYYVFEGWQYYDAEGENRRYIQYGSDNLPSDPSKITINGNVEIHGLWTEHELSTVAGHITINKTFVNKPQGNNLDNFYISVIHNGVPTHLSPAQLGDWNTDNTSWTYNFPISESGNYTIVEGKYDVAGYNVTSASTVTEVAGISSNVVDYRNEDIFITDGHSYYGVGKTLTVTLHFDTSAVDGAAARAGSEGVHAATVNFVNTYAKRSAGVDHAYPDLHIRKWDDQYLKLLPGATFALTKQGDDSFSHTLTTDAAGEATTAEHSDHFEEHDIVLEAGTYYLTETQAPKGYFNENHSYTITVTKTDTQEELRRVCQSHGENALHVNACYSYVTVQNYAMTVTDAEGNAHTSPDFCGRFNPSMPRLNIPNNQIKADLTLKKAFLLGGQTFTPQGDAAGASILVDIYGPVTYEGTEVKDIGALLYNDLVISKDNDWSVEIPDLTYGDYFVEEVMGSMHGYTLKNTTFKDKTAVTVGDHTGAVVRVENANPQELTIRNEYEKWTSADFYVMKTDEQKNDIAGVTFKLMQGNTDVTAQHLPEGVTSAVTDVNGNLHFTNFSTPGTYQLMEVASAPGYYRGTTVYDITVTVDAQKGEYDISINSGAWDKTDDTLTVLNKPILGQIHVGKSFDGDRVPEDDTLIVYRLSNEDGSVYRVASVAKDDKWEHTFQDLPLGKYTITETCTLNGYTYTTTHKVNNDAPVQGAVAEVTLTDNSGGTLSEGLPSGAKAEVVFTNTFDRQEKLTVNAAAFNVLKVDEHGEALSGATFTLFDENGNALNASQVPFATTSTSDANGIASFTGLKLADLKYSEYVSSTARSAVFLLKEAVAPDGYVLKADTTWKITLTEKKIKVDEVNDRGIFETVIDWIAGLGQDSTGEWISNSGAIPMLKVSNQRIKGNLTVNKTYTNVEGEDYKKANVEIHIHGPITRNTDNSIKDIGPMVDVIKLSNGATSATLEGLELGEYVLRETFASIHGYTWNDVTYTVDGSSTAKETYQDKEFASFTVDSATPDVSVALTNSYAKWEKLDFTVYKYSHYNSSANESDKLSTGLPNATFVLSRSSTDFDEGSANVVATASTGIAGYATFAELDGPANQGDTITYYLKETVAPTNYKPISTVWTVTLSNGTNGYDIAIDDGNNNHTGTGWAWNGEMDVLSVANEEILGSIQVKKEFVDNLIPDGLEKIAVVLYAKDGTRKGSVDLTAANNWNYTFTGLSMGEYYVIEDGAAVPGYTLTTGYYVGGEEEDNAYAKVILAPGANNSEPATAVVEIRNDYEKQTELITLPTSLTIVKRESGTEKPLPGAKFQLKDKNNNIVANGEKDYWETDSNGTITITKLDLTGRQYADYMQSTERDPVTYTLSEIAAPDGYKRLNQDWTITLAEQEVKVNEVLPETNIFTTIIQAIFGTVLPSNSSASAEISTFSDGVLTVYNAPIKGKLNVYKEYSFNDNPLQLPHASSEIHVHGPFQSTTVTAEQFAAATEHKAIITGTEAEFKDLPLGYYLVHEPYSSVHGYNWTVGGSFDSTTTATVTHADSRTVTYYVYQITPNQQEGTANNAEVYVTNSYTKWTAADFWVHKIDEAGKNLPGATFRLLDGTTDVTAKYLDSSVNGSSAVSNDSGVIHFHNFTLGENEDSKTFTLEEVSAPAGYNLGTKTWEIEVSHDGTGYNLKIDGAEVDNDTIVVTNPAMKGSLKIVKNFAGDKIYGLTTTSEPVNLSIPVKITCPDGSVKDITLSGNSAATELTATVENLPLGTYTVTEPSQTAQIAGYDLLHTEYQVGNEKTNSVTLTNETQCQVTITNTYDRNERVINKPTQFTILKVDENDQPLAGAEFTLTNDHDTTEIHTYVTGADGRILVDGLIGNGTLTSQSARSYTLQETKAPDGFAIGQTNIWKVEITEQDGNPAITLNEQNRTYETVWDWLASVFERNNVLSDGTLKVVNQRKAATVSVEKTVEYSGLTVSETDEYVTKYLKDAVYTFELYIDGVRKETLELKHGESATFNRHVPYESSYEVVEVVPENALFTVSMTNASGTVGTQELDGIVVEAKNTYKFQENSSLKLNMIKVSSDHSRKPLEGAQFALYDGESKILGRYRSDKNGNFIVGEITKPGEYTLKETVAPSGYYALKKPITIDAKYVYTVVKVDGKPVIEKTLVASVDGRGVYEIGFNCYGIKNTMITGNPVTGDDFNLFMWIGVTVFSLLSLAMTILFFPRKKGKYSR